MGEAELGLAVVLSGDVEDNIGAVPLVLVLDEVEASVLDVPHDLFARHEFCDLLLAVMNVLIPIREHFAVLVGPPFNFSRPPAANVVNGVEDLSGTFIYREGSRVGLAATQNEIAKAER